MIKQIEPVRSFRGTLENLPADKSISHRAAMFAALAEGTSHIDNYPASADPQSTLACLSGLGVEVNYSDNKLTITSPGKDGFKPVTDVLDCGNSGTTMRLLSGIVAGAGLNVTLTGDHSLNGRPMKRIIDPLRQMGAEITHTEKGTAPLVFRKSSGLKGIHYPLPIASAQVKSCVLLAGLYAEGQTTVVEFHPSRDHTERLLGLETERRDDGSTAIYSSRASVIEPLNMKIPGDISGAAFWLVAGCIYHDSEIVLKNVGINPTRNAVISVLQRMGANIQVTVCADSGKEPLADIKVSSSELKSVELAPEEIPNCIDEIPVLAVAMAFADGDSEIRNAEELRAKETDRIMAVATMLKSAGVDCTEYKDGFKVKGNPGFKPNPAEYASWHDHRMAMASAILAGRSTGPSTIKDSDATAVSYPGFWKDFEQLRV